MSYLIPDVTVSHFVDKDARIILMDAVNLIEGIHHGLFHIAGSDYSIEKDDCFIQAWDDILEAATDELNLLYPVNTHSLSQVITKQSIIDGLDSGDIGQAIMEILVIMQMYSMNVIMESEYSTRTSQIQEVLSQYKNIRDMIEWYGTIRTAEERIRIFLDEIEEFQEETGSHAAAGSQYLATCDTYTDAVIGHPGHAATQALRDIVADQSGSLTAIDSQMLDYIDSIELKLTQLNGSHNITLLEETEVIYDDAVLIHSQAGVMVEDAAINTEDCIDTAIDGFAASYDYPFSPSEKIRISAVVPGPTNLSVSYSVDANAPTDSVSITIDDTDHIIIGYVGTQPPTINEVVSQINLQVGTRVSAVNLNISGAGGVIKANQSFVRTRLQGLVVA